MEFVDDDGYHGFHQGDGGCQRGEQHQQEEQRSDDLAELAAAHAVKYLGQSLEHKPGAGLHGGLVAAGENEHCGNDHQAGQKGDAGIEDLNLGNRFFNTGFLFHIRAIGDHNSHGQRHGIEHLPHSAQHRVDGEPGEIGDQIEFNALQRAGQGAGIYAHSDAQHDQNRHHKLVSGFDAALYAAEDDNKGNDAENSQPEHRLKGLSDKAAEIIVAGSLHVMAGQEGDEIFGHPAADYAVIG